MDCKISSYFFGTINGIEFRNENNYMSVGNILYTIEEMYGKFYNRQALVKILRDAYALCMINGVPVDIFEETCVGNIKRGSHKFLPKSVPEFKDMNAAIEEVMDAGI